MDLEFRLESPPLFILYYACVNDLLEILPVPSISYMRYHFFLFFGCCCWDRVSKMRSLCSWGWPLLLIHAWITGMCYHVKQQPPMHGGYFYPKIPLMLRPETNKMVHQINFNHRDNKFLANDLILKYPHKNPQKLRHCLFLLITASSKLKSEFSNNLHLLCLWEFQLSVKNKFYKIEIMKITKRCILLFSGIRHLKGFSLTLFQVSVIKLGKK